MEVSVKTREGGGIEEYLEDSPSDFVIDCRIKVKDRKASRSLGNPWMACRTTH